MNEKEFTQIVRDLARQTGWAEYHAWNSRRSPAGFPDLVLLRPPRLVFAELKTETGRVTGPQREWLAGLERVPGVEVFLWRPRDLERIGVILSPKWRLEPPDIEGVPA